MERFPGITFTHLFGTKPVRTLEPPQERFYDPSGHWPPGLGRLGTIDATVDTGDMIPANHTYDSIGFTEAYRGHIWRKVL